MRRLDATASGEDKYRFAFMLISIAFDALTEEEQQHLLHALRGKYEQTDAQSEF